MVEHRLRMERRNPPPRGRVPSSIIGCGSGLYDLAGRGLGGLGRRARGAPDGADRRLHLRLRRLGGWHRCSTSFRGWWREGLSESGEGVCVAFPRTLPPCFTPVV